MSLQQVVEYFNDRLEQEYQSGFRPFILEAGAVHGILGPIRIGSIVKPLRKTLRSTQVIGHIAKQEIAANRPQPLKSRESEKPQIMPSQPRPDYESVINFDRLSRAVHLLNYIPHAHPDEPLFLDVDPRHILGIKEDHGAYFEEMIVRCGLKTGNITISLAINDVYVRFYSALLKGLDNYQRRGYRVSLRFDYPRLEKTSIELLSRAGPDYVALSADDLERKHDARILEKLNNFTSLADSINSHSILLNVDDKRSVLLARQANFDLLHGKYFEQPDAAGIDNSLPIRHGEPARFPI